MILEELKEIINNISSDYDDFPILDGNIFDPEIDIDIKVMSYLGHEYLSCNIETKN